MSSLEQNENKEGNICYKRRKLFIISQVEVFLMHRNAKFNGKNVTLIPFCLVRNLQLKLCILFATTFTIIILMHSHFTLETVTYTWRAVVCQPSESELSRGAPPSDWSSKSVTKSHIQYNLLSFDFFVRKRTFMRFSCYCFVINN